jgi:hypothetical protein
MNRYILMIDMEGAGVDVGEIELPRLPNDGDPIETKYGTCLVTSTKDEPERAPLAGTIVCRLP